MYYLLSIEKAVYLNYTLNLQKSLKIEMRFHTLFYIIWGYNNTYHEIYGSIIFVVGKSPMDIMELIFV